MRTVSCGGGESEALSSVESSSCTAESISRQLKSSKRSRMPSSRSRWASAVGKAALEAEESPTLDTGTPPPSLPSAKRAALVKSSPLRWPYATPPMIPW